MNIPDSLNGKKKTVLKMGLLIPVAIMLLMSGCSDSTEQTGELREALTFYASFDGALEADYAAGDAAIYTAPSWDQRLDYEPFETDAEYIQIHNGEGRYGDALWIDNRHEPVFFYKGEDNIAYNRENWSGTVSFWMRLDPLTDLHPGYSDPIQITASAWNDGALFVDFTDEEPRIFRFAIFADRNVWDPEEREWNDVPLEERRMVDIEEHPFSREEWTHVAFTFSHFNTGEKNGVVHCYLNGKKAGMLSAREQTFTWNPSELFIWLGYNYQGYFDELSIFDRDFTEDEIRILYGLEGGIRQILK